MARTRIGLFLVNQENDYQQRMREDALAAAARLRFDLGIFGAQNDPARQVAQISEVMDGHQASEMMALMVSPVRDDLLADLARTVASAGAGWVVLNREAPYLSELREAFPSLPIFGVSPDQVSIGRIHGEQMKRLIPEGGEVVYVTGLPKTSSARRRLEGVQAELVGSKISLTVLEADWTSEGARLVAGRWIEGAGMASALPRGFVAQNDAMALGVRQALRDAASRLSSPELVETPILGCDGSPDFGQRLVRESRITATVTLPSVTGPALDWVARARDGKEWPDLLVTLPVRSFPDVGKLVPRSR